MTANDRAELIKLIINTMYQHAKGDPDLLARRIVDEIETTGWGITQPISILRDAD